MIDDKRKLFNLHLLNKDDLDILFDKADEFDAGTLGNSGGKALFLFHPECPGEREFFLQAVECLGMEVASLDWSTNRQSGLDLMKATLDGVLLSNPDVIVASHPKYGNIGYLARNADAVTITVHDGNTVYAPALMHVYFLHKQLNGLKDRRVLLLGDFINNPWGRAYYHLLSVLEAKVVVCAPGTLLPAFPRFTNICDLNQACVNIDLAIILPLPDDALKNGLISGKREYAKYFALARRHLDLAKPGVGIFSPVQPEIGVELNLDVCNSQFIVSPERKHIVSLYASLLQLHSLAKNYKHAEGF